MADNQKKKLTPVQQQYQELAKRHEPPRPVLANCIRAFIAGGTICLIGQIIQMMYKTWLHFPKEKANTATVATLILLSVILTCFGVYDKIGQWAGAGSAVPVTGFANSMASSAIEHRSEGMVLGVGGKMFELAGSVIVFGTVAAFIIAFLHLLFNPIMTPGGS
ncbi:stage V sporulation protein AC [Risungbinella massiliensis]|uniref:stage V sporulation protein AC n=1 Tax=Risungbinella massiliensis TaxID=1329796 RepID=UPI0005CBAD99|nr:stage V sporulation protein AC [Risungbinella massiliensis]